MKLSDRLGIDVGGTFTDVVHQDRSGTLRRTKVLSSAQQAGTVISEALDRLKVDGQDLSQLVHATTLVTNLIIERAGARVGLLTTRGFRDVLEIGLSYRENPFDLQAEKAVPLVPRPRRREIEERMSPAGEVLVPINLDEVLDETQALVDDGVEAIAVSLLHSHVNDLHELQAEAAIRSRFPELMVSLASVVDPQIREFERTSTAAINAYVMPAVVRYDNQLRDDVSIRREVLRYMHSGGGMVPPLRACSRPVELVSSGPAGGVLAAAFLGRELGMRDLVTFDIGGTSSDVCVVEDGEIQQRDEIEIEWGVPLRVRSIDVTWVGAGGGSIGWVDPGGTLAVGPRSAGAHPGPACYGHGGSEPTVTDANLVLGLLDPDRFLGGRIRLDSSAAERAVDSLAKDFEVSREEVALGIRRIAIANMAQAVHSITVQQGVDPRGFTLVAFGGAGGQHAIDVAVELEISRVLFPPLASTFSAFGLLCADAQVTERQAFLRDVDDEVGRDGERLFRELTERARESLGLSGEVEVVASRFAHVRYAGQSHELVVPIDRQGWSALPARFEDAHERRFGTRLGDPVEVMALGVTLASPRPAPSFPDCPPSMSEPEELGSVEVYGIDEPVSVIDRTALGRGDVVVGPVILTEEDSTIVVGPGWRGEVGRLGEILCQRDK